MAKLGNIGVASIALLAVSVLGCGGKSHDAQQSGSSSSMKATVAVVAKTAMPVAYEAVGTVRSKTASTVQSKVTGNVLTVAFNEGDSVEAGRLLVKIDDREMVAMLQRAESALAEAQKAVDEAEQGVRAAGAAQRAAEAQQSLAAATFERFKNLLASNAVSKQTFDEADAKNKSAAAETARAAEMFKSFEARRAEVLARVEQAKAEVANAKVMLDYTEVKAPYAGIVTRKHINVGDMAAPGQPLFEMEDNRHYRVEAAVNESQGAAIRVGDPADILLDGSPQNSVKGAVDEITSSADAATRTFNVKVAVPEGTALRSGTFARARFHMGQQDMLTVPASAVVERGQLTSVFVIDESSVARMRLVKTGRQTADSIEILSGLGEGETVVAAPGPEIRDGVRIEHS